jgi:uncharacterized protein YndB with AHSA1/START domain
VSDDHEQAQRPTVTTPSDREIHVERVFNAPRDRVFAAFTDPTLIPQWWGGGTVVDAMDVRPGGSWRFVSRQPNGYEMAFRGTYREVVPPERLVQTFEIEAMPGRVHVEAFSFTDLGPRTRLNLVMSFNTPEERDGVLNSGMQAGMEQTYGRLEELLVKLAAR